MTTLAAVRHVGAIAVFFAMTACGAETPIEPDPVYEQKTEAYSGSIASGGSAAFHFPVTNPGSINLAITQLGPVSTLTMGLWLGSWDATTSTCPQQLSTSAATLNLVFSGDPSGPGEYCVAIFDVGNVQTSVDFTLTVTHY